jgi:aminocarboxymuconate-semialdehyde decarboxylase
MRHETRHRPRTNCARRPWQWVKNGLVLAALVFSHRLFHQREEAEPDRDSRHHNIQFNSPDHGVFPTRLVPSAVLPLGDMGRALHELERSLAMGMRVVNLPSSFRGAYLGDARFADLWAAIRQHELVAFIHPEGVTDMWFQDYALWNSIGQSIEEVKVMSSLIYEGTMDKHSGLKIVMAHGGGYMPHYMGRLDRNVTDKPFTTKNLSKKPSEYLTDFFYDSCVYDPRTLELLVERVGIDRVVLGGDYPAALLDPIDFLETTNLEDKDRAEIAGGNAMKLLGLA